MGSLFKGLDAFGMDEAENIHLFEEENVMEKKVVKPKRREEDLIYGRSMMCPVCGTYFETFSVKQGVAKSSGVAINLRPIYSVIDPLRYDVVHCEVCGYAALNRNFKKVSDRQVRAIREKISMKFVGKKFPKVISYEVALERYKLALYSDVVMGRTSVNLAFLCLKASWILESLIEACADKEKRETYKEEYQSFVQTAYAGFVKSYGYVTFPVFGMNQSTYHYLLGVLAYESGDMKGTGHWLGKVMLDSSVSSRLKARARELKEKIDLEKEARTSAQDS